MTTATPPGHRPGRATGHRAPTRRLPHFPALDGLRGLAVAAVVCFHGGFGWASGGFLGVSTFFTLSGFLITSLLLLEHDATGRVDLRSFWARRLRRLAPAAYAAIALALAYGLLAADALSRADLAGDVAASVAQVANWWFLASGQSYAELFAGPSPLLHFWSLAVEEQFYLLFPLGVWAVLHRAGWSRSRLVAVLALVGVAATLTPFVVTMSTDAVYYGTWTRAPELVAGALLACLVHRPGVAARLAEDGPASRTLAVLGTVGLVASVLAWTLVDRADAALYQGGLALYALGSASVVGAALLPGGPVARVLSTGALRHLGTISYGVYVYHWPLFLWLDEGRTGLDGLPLLALRLAVTLGVAEASFHLLEQPIRRGGSIVGLRPSLALLPAAACAITLGLVVSATAPAPAVDLASAADELALADRRGALDGGAPRPDALDPGLVGEDAPPPRVAFFGDSTAMMVAFGFGTHLDELRRAGADPGVTTTGGVARLGCGIARGGERRNAQGGVDRITSYCDDWPATWAEKVRVFSPTLAVVQVGPWEVVDRKMPGDDRWRGPGDPVYDEWLHGELLAAVDVLTVDGAGVVWLTTPAVGERADRGDWGSPGVRDPARWDAFNAVVRRLEADRPDAVRVVDLAAWAEADDRDAELRPDGVHYSREGAAVVADELLVDEVRTANVELWEAGRARRLALATERSAEPPPEVPGPGETLRVVVWGDDTATALGEALGRTPSAEGPVEVATVTEAGCGVTRPEERRVDGRRVPAPACTDRARLDEVVAATDPHVVLVAPGAHEQAEVRFSDEEGAFSHPNATDFDDWARAEYGEATDHLRRDGRAVLLVVPPPVASGGGVTDEATERAGGIARLLEDLAASRSRRRHVGLVDLAGWFASLPEGPGDAGVRPDGLHLSPGGAASAAAWLLPVVRAELDRLAGPGATEEPRAG